MEHIKNNIAEYRSLFESDLLPKGHKERFFQKMEGTSKQFYRKPYIYYIAAVMILAFIVATPIFNFKRVSNINEIAQNNYVSIINEKNADILSMIESLDALNKELVLSTLDQLVFEAVPFKDQIPQSIGIEQRAILEQRYYNPKIEGMNQLKNYVSQLLEL